MEQISRKVLHPFILNKIHISNVAIFYDSDGDPAEDKCALFQGGGRGERKMGKIWRESL